MTEAEALVERIDREMAGRDRGSADPRDGMLFDCQDALTRQAARIAELEKAFGTYARHDFLCALVGAYGECDCGLRVALEGEPRGE